MDVRGILKLTKEQKDWLNSGSINYIDFDKSTMVRKIIRTIITRFVVMLIIVFGAIQTPSLKNIPELLKTAFLVFYLIYFIAYMPYFSIMNSFDLNFVYHIFEKRVYIQKKRTKTIFEILASKYLKLENERCDCAYNWGRISANILIVIIDITLLIFENQFQWSFCVSFFFYLIVSFLICFIVFTILNCIEWFAGYSLSFSKSKKIYWGFILLFLLFDIWIVITDKQGLICLIYKFIDWMDFPPDFYNLIKLFDTFLQEIGIGVITFIYSKIKNHSDKNNRKNLVNFATIWIIMFSIYKYDIIVQVIVSSIALFYIDIDNTSKNICDYDNQELE
jgi:hypothetical protein